MAFVVRKANSTLAEDDVQTFVEENVAPYKKLRGGVEFIDEVPKSLSGKILRRELRDKVKELAKVEKPMNTNRSFRRRSQKQQGTTNVNGVAIARNVAAKSTCCVII